VIASPGKVALIEDTGYDYGIKELAERYIRDADLILVEGFKDNPFPKIEVSRIESHHDLICSKEDNLIALAADAIYDRGVPCYDINDIDGLALLIEDRFLKRGRFPSRHDGEAGKREVIEFLSEIDWLKVMKWVLIVLIAGFIGQFGKMLANHFVAKARLKRKKEEKLRSRGETAGVETEPGSLKGGEAAPSPPAGSAKEKAKIEKKRLKALAKQKKKELKLLEKENKE
jgi:hypothetical protein